MEKIKKTSLTYLFFLLFCLFLGNVKKGIIENIKKETWELWLSRFLFTVAALSTLKVIILWALNAVAKMNPNGYPLDPVWPWLVLALLSFLLGIGFDTSLDPLIDTQENRKRELIKIDYK